MKRWMIWVICIVMGISFMVLLYLQMQYADAMVTMRKEQFDESVFRSLDQASRDLERSETVDYLTHMTEMYGSSLDSLSHDPYAPVQVRSTVDTLFAGKGTQTIILHTPRLLQNLTLHAYDNFTKAGNQFRERVRSAYLYERDVLDEVILTVLYSASNKNFQERINTRLLDNSLRVSLEANGITLPFHFIVYSSDGREVYRCPDYDPTGSEYTYSQTLFRNDPSGKMGYVQVHFPGVKHYILGVASMVAPAFFFTLILLVTFLITVYLVVRQKKVTEMKNDFINNMTHEFKTPISTISIAAQLLADKSISKTTEMYERYSGVIVAETKRLRFQVEKVLQMSLYDHNNIALKTQVLDANNLIDSVVETFSLKVKQNGGELVAHLDAEMADVSVDEMHFTNIIFNLMDNAVKYKREDVALHLEVSTYNQGNNLLIKISDNGIGIKREDLRRIFEKFYRVHTGNKHNVKGFGLGLAYVQKMVALHHGTIKATSELGYGTEFVITLPLDNS